MGTISYQYHQDYGHDHQQQHHKQYQGMVVRYLQMVEQSLRKLLYWLGDEDTLTKSFDDVGDDYTDMDHVMSDVKEKKM